MSHAHDIVQENQIDENFAAHPKLYAWLRQYLKFPEATQIKAQEFGCADNSCPIVETILQISLPDGQTRFLKIGRALNQISKNDVYFAVKKQAMA